jgi:hypothetical protein
MEENTKTEQLQELDEKQLQAITGASRESLYHQNRAKHYLERAEGATNQRDVDRFSDRARAHIDMALKAEKSMVPVQRERQPLLGDNTPHQEKEKDYVSCLPCPIL